MFKQPDDWCFNHTSMASSCGSMQPIHLWYGVLTIGKLNKNLGLPIPGWRWTLLAQYLVRAPIFTPQSKYYNLSFDTNTTTQQQYTIQQYACNGKYHGTGNFCGGKFSQICASLSKYLQILFSWLVVTARTLLLLLCIKWNSLWSKTWGHVKRWSVYLQVPCLHSMIWIVSLGEEFPWKCEAHNTMGHKAVLVDEVPHHFWTSERTSRWTCCPCATR